PIPPARGRDPASGRSITRERRDNDYASLGYCVFHHRPDRRHPPRHGDAERHRGADRLLPGRAVPDPVRDLAGRRPRRRASCLTPGATRARSGGGMTPLISSGVIPLLLFWKKRRELT